MAKELPGALDCISTDHCLTRLGVSLVDTNSRPVRRCSYLNLWCNPLTAMNLEHPLIAVRCMYDYSISNPRNFLSYPRHLQRASAYIDFALNGCIVGHNFDITSSQ